MVSFIRRRHSAVSVRYLAKVPLFVEGSTETVSMMLQQLAASASSVYQLSGEKRKNYISLLCFNNFVNHLYALSGSFLRQKEFHLTRLLLIDETAAKVRNAPIRCANRTCCT